MRSDRSGSILVAAAALLLAACTGPDTLSDPATSFTATLTAAQVVGGGQAGASGTATITASGDYNVTFTGLSGAVTDISIYDGDAGTSGTAEVNLCGACGASPAQGNAGAIPSGTLGDMRTFGAYVAVSTANGEEIRGQIFGVY